jgi:hypothetical protein
MLPRGTTISRGNENRPWSVVLPANAGVYIAALATTAPPGVTLSIANDGRLVSIGSGHGQTIRVRGVPLNSKAFKVLGSIVASELAETFAIAGETLPAGTPVRIDLQLEPWPSRSGDRLGRSLQSAPIRFWSEGLGLSPRAQDKGRITAGIGR